MNLIKKLLVIFLLASIFGQEFCYSQISSIKQEYLNYLEDNYYSLNSIEGIYRVKLEIDKSIMYCNFCNYSKYSNDNFDEIVIIRKDNKFEISSIRRNVILGYIESINSNQDFQRSDLLIRMNSINYPKVNISCSFYGNTIVQTSSLEYLESRNVFEYDITRKLDIKCNEKVDDYLALICYALEVTHTYTKIFPEHDFKPKPIKFTGTGFLINKEGHIVTNYHVIKRPENMKGDFREDIKLVHEQTKTEFKGKLLYYNEDIDLAVIKIIIPQPDWKNYKVLKISPFPKSISTSVSTVGYPFSGITGDNIKYTKGYISSESGAFNAASLYTIDLSINPGNSGGPLLDSKNNVVGIINARLNDEAVGSKVENISFAIKSKYLIDFLKGNSIACEILSSNDKIVKTIDEIKRGIFLIEFTVSHY